MRNISVLLLCLVALSPAYALKSIPAKWQHDLESTYLKDFAKGEHLVLSSIRTDTPGVDTVTKYHLKVKVTEWGKPFTKSYESSEQNYKEVLTVTLYESDNKKEMKAEYDHVVYENNEVKLRFSGVTVLVRVN